MDGGLIAVVFVGTAVLIGVANTVRRRMMRRMPPWAATALAFIGLLIAWPFVIGAVSQIVVAAGTRVGLDTTPEHANRMLRELAIPPEAEGIDVRTSYFGGCKEEVDFSVDEEGFAAWIGSYQGLLIAFSAEKESDPLAAAFVEAVGRSGTVITDRRCDQLFGPIYAYPVRSYVSSDGVWVSSGYSFRDATEEDPDYGRTIVYDLDARRVYARFSVF